MYQQMYIHKSKNSLKKQNKKSKNIFKKLLSIKCINNVLLTNMSIFNFYRYSKIYDLKC